MTASPQLPSPVRTASAPAPPARNLRRCSIYSGSRRRARALQDRACRPGARVPGVRGARPRERLRSWRRWRRGALPAIRAGARALAGSARSRSRAVRAASRRSARGWRRSPDTPANPAAASAGSAEVWWKPRVAASAALALLLAGKLKFLLLGLTKVSTFASMFGFIARVLVDPRLAARARDRGSIYVHEMGHVAMLRRLGIHAGAPLFIPGVGALVMLKQHIADPVATRGSAWPVRCGDSAPRSPRGRLPGDRRADLAGDRGADRVPQPVQPDPVWQLDGARGFHALSRAGAAGSSICVMAARAVADRAWRLLVDRRRRCSFYQAVPRQTGTRP